MNGGIIDRAEKGTKAYTEAEIKEKIATAYSEYNMSKYQNGIFLAQACANSGLAGATADGSDESGWTVSYNGKDYPISTTGSVGDAIIQWKQNSDGSISNGEVAGIQVGDVVHYETILNQSANAVNTTKLATLKSDLATYSGDSSSTENSSIARDNLEWKVLDVKDGKIRLISTVPTTSKIGLYGGNGYNNAVFLLDKVCDTLYSINGVGKAQNLKIEDIEEKLNVIDGKTSKDNYTNNYVTPNLKYGNEKEYTSNLQYPNIYLSEIGCKGIEGESGTNNNTGTLGLSLQPNPIKGKNTATSRLKVTQTFWTKSMVESDFIDKKYFTLFINNGNLGTYWLSSRCVHCDPNHVSFIVRRISNRFLHYCFMFYSYDDANGDDCAFRPVVSLESNIKLSGDSTNGWTIQ